MNRLLLLFLVGSPAFAAQPVSGGQFHCELPNNTVILWTDDYGHPDPAYLGPRRDYKTHVLPVFAMPSGPLQLEKGSYLAGSVFDYVGPGAHGSGLGSYRLTATSPSAVKVRSMKVTSENGCTVLAELRGVEAQLVVSPKQEILLPLTSKVRCEFFVIPAAAKCLPGRDSGG